MNLEMHSRFLPEPKNKHKDKMEACDARKGAASRGVMEVFDTTMLVACCLQGTSGLAGGSEEKYIQIYIASLLHILPKEHCHTGMANTVNLEQGYSTGTRQIV